MLRNRQCSFLKDLKIEKLRLGINYEGDHYGKLIVLTKSMVSYRNTTHPTIANSDFPPDYFDTSYIPITSEQFNQLADKIRVAGLRDLQKKQRNTIIQKYETKGFIRKMFHTRSSKLSIYNSLPTGAVFESLHCLYDNGAEFDYITVDTRDKEFDAIVKIMLSFTGLNQNETATIVNKANSRKESSSETFCCNALSLDRWQYCPKCGSQIGPTQRKRSHMYLNLEETLWRCSRCGEGIPFIYRFCGNCGKEREW